MAKSGYPHVLGSSSPLILEAVNKADTRLGRWVAVNYRYQTRNFAGKPSANLSGIAAYYAKKFPNYNFRTSPAGRLLVQKGIV